MAFESLGGIAPLIQTSVLDGPWVAVLRRESPVFLAVKWHIFSWKSVGEPNCVDWGADPMVARSKGWVCGSSLVATPGSNPAGGMDISVFTECCVLSGWGLCLWLISHPGDSIECVVSECDQWGCPGPLGSVMPRGEKNGLNITVTFESVIYLT
jgi:hypothetical protein